jgi:hypothetical protein
MTHSIPNLSASSSRTAVETLHPLITSYEDIALKQGIALSPSLLLELHAFLQRNRILGSALETPVIPEEDVCPDCLKAHALTQAAAHGVSEKEKLVLEKKLPGKIGHEEWYLDGDALKRI